MKSKGIRKIHFLNKYTKGKTKEQIIKEFSELKLGYWYISQLIEINNKIKFNIKN